MTTATVSAEKSRRRGAPLGGSLLFLLVSLPLGTVTFSLILALGLSGIATVVVWVGIPLLGALLLLVRSVARMERARVYAQLDAYIDRPYLPLPEKGLRQRWTARLRDTANWRDLAYLFLLFPLGLIEFVLVTTFWAVGAGLVALPIYFRFLPDGAWFFPGPELRWITVDSTVSALPWAALGVLVIALAAALTKALGTMHRSFAVAMLQPTVAQRRRMERSWQPVDETPVVTG